MISEAKIIMAGIFLGVALSSAIFYVVLEPEHVIRSVVHEDSGTVYCRIDRPFGGWSDWTEKGSVCHRDPAQRVYVHESRL